MMQMLKYTFRVDVICKYNVYLIGLQYGTAVSEYRFWLIFFVSSVYVFTVVNNLSGKPFEKVGRRLKISVQFSHNKQFTVTILVFVVSSDKFVGRYCLLEKMNAIRR